MTDSALSPTAALMSLITGKFMTQAISTAAELRLADHLQDGPLTAGELARRTGADASAVYRLLRALAMAGVFTEHEGRSFSLTPVGGCCAPARRALWLAWRIFLRSRGITRRGPG